MKKTNNQLTGVIKRSAERRNRLVENSCKMLRKTLDLFGAGYDADWCKSTLMAYSQMLVRRSLNNDEFEYIVNVFSIAELLKIATVLETCVCRNDYDKYLAGCTATIKRRRLAK